MTTTLDWSCSRAGRSRSIHPKMSTIWPRRPCGLLRSAQTENPGRILLVDVDDWASADAGVAEAARRDETQLALRGGLCFAPRLVRAERL
jgi:hypothetical protein